MDHLMRWFCRRADAVETQRQIAEIERQVCETSQHVADKLEDAGRQLNDHRQRLDLIQRRARIRYREPDPGHHGGGSDYRNGGHASGGAA
jgi:hypothetical protein